MIHYNISQLFSCPQLHEHFNNGRHHSSTSNLAIAALCLAGDCCHWVASPQHLPWTSSFVRFQMLFFPSITTRLCPNVWWCTGSTLPALNLTNADISVSLRIFIYLPGIVSVKFSSWFFTNNKPHTCQPVKCSHFFGSEAFSLASCQGTTGSPATKVCYRWWGRGFEWHFELGVDDLDGGFRQGGLARDDEQHFELGVEDPSSTVAPKE